SSHVFMTERDGPMTPKAFHALFGRIGARAKMQFPIHPHMLRHGCGYALANAGHTRGHCKLGWGTRTSSTRCATPSCRLTGSRTSGAEASPSRHASDPRGWGLKRCHRGVPLCLALPIPPCVDSRRTSGAARPKPVHSSSDALSVAAWGGYEWARVPGLRWAGHRQRSLGVKGEGYGSNRSREGPNTTSPRRWSAERGRHRAGPPRLARSKGPAGYRDDDRGQQVANPIPPRSRPYGLMSADAPGRVRVGCFLRAWCGVSSARAAVRPT